MVPVDVSMCVWGTLAHMCVHVETQKLISSVLPHTAVIIISIILVIIVIIETSSLTDPGAGYFRLDWWTNGSLEYVCVCLTGLWLHPALT